MPGKQLRDMTAADRMTPDPLAVAPDQNLRQALETMQARRIRHLPVVAAGQLVGVVTDRDIREAMPSPEIIAEVPEAYSFLAMVRVAEVMVAQVVTVAPDTPLGEAAGLLLERKIGCLPVVSDGRLVGILTESDIFRAFMEILGLLPAGDSET